MLADYAPADGWVLKYRFVGGVFDQTITADSSTGTYTLTLAAATSATIVGELVARLIGWVELGTEKYTIYDQVVTIEPNARTATAAQLLTHNEKMVAALEAVTENRATDDIESYTIGGRSVTKLKPEEVLRWLGVYRARVWRDHNPGRSFPGHQVRMRAPR